MAGCGWLVEGRFHSDMETPWADENLVFVKMVKTANEVQNSCPLTYFWNWRHQATAQCFNLCSTTLWGLILSHCKKAKLELSFLPHKSLQGTSQRQGRGRGRRRRKWREGAQRERRQRRRQRAHSRREVHPKEDSRQFPHEVHEKGMSDSHTRFMGKFS